VEEPSGRLFRQQPAPARVALRKATAAAAGSAWRGGPCGRPAPGAGDLVHWRLPPQPGAGNQAQLRSPPLAAGHRAGKPQRGGH